MSVSSKLIIANSDVERLGGEAGALILIQDAINGLVKRTFDEKVRSLYPGRAAGIQLTFRVLNPLKIREFRYTPYVGNGVDRSFFRSCFGIFVGEEEFTAQSAHYRFPQFTYDGKDAVAFDHSQGKVTNIPNESHQVSVSKNTDISEYLSSEMNFQNESNCMLVYMESWGKSDVAIKAISEALLANGIEHFINWRDSSEEVLKVSAA